MSGIATPLVWTIGDESPWGRIGSPSPQYEQMIENGLRARDPLYGDPSPEILSHLTSEQGRPPQ